MFWGFLFIAIGVAWILQYYGIIPKDFQFFWPGIFIVIGLSILFGRRKSSCWGMWDKDKEKEKDKEGKQ